MTTLTLADVCAVTDGRLTDGAQPTTLVSGPVVVDSRAVESGGLFVALAGEHVDGHDFAADAVRDGAVAVLVARPVGVPAVVVDDPLDALAALARSVLAGRADLTVVGVTGSSGKTTTKDLIASVLATYGETVAAPGSYNGEIGLPLSVLRCSDTTRYLVLEYGARGLGHIAELTSIARPDIAVVLNVGVAHVGVFGDVDTIAKAKGELVEALEPSALAVLNADDPKVAAMAARTAARVVTVGRAPDAAVRADDVVLDADGRPSFMLRTPAGAAPVTLRLHGAHHVGNALAAAAVGLDVGLDVPSLAAALSAAAPVSRWRMEVTEADGITVVNDAYNANPASMAAGLRALADMGRGRRTWAVLGSMAELGTYADDAHREVGALVATLGLDRLVAVEAPLLVEGAVAAGLNPASAALVDGVDAAVALLRTELAAGDIVFVKASRSMGLERVAAALVEGPVRA